MARTSLATIITRVRVLVDDTDATVFTDDDIQHALDPRRDEARYWRPEMRMVIAPGGTSTKWLIFDAGFGPWEDDVVLLNSRFYQITPDTSDNAAGRWTFNDQPNIPVMVNGFVHDVYGAAADLLMTRAAMEAAAFDVKADGTELSRSQKAPAWEARANAYYAKARPRTSDLVRTDEREDRP
jgi:hypothetical protein